MQREDLSQVQSAQVAAEKSSIGGGRLLASEVCDYANQSWIGAIFTCSEIQRIVDRPSSSFMAKAFESQSFVSSSRLSSEES